MSLITLVDAMGSDLTVVNAARVSMDKMSSWALAEPVATIEECQTRLMTDTAARPGAQIIEHQEGGFTYEKIKLEDVKLIHYLAKNNHFSPFTHCSLQFRIKQPIFVARQWYRHRIGIEKDSGWNEVSRRYVKDEPEFFTPDKWRKAAEHVKQGSSMTEAVEMIFGEKKISNMYAAHVEASSRLYQGMIEAGVAPEQARMVLPMSMMTEWVETGSLYAYANLCHLRLDPHAQVETRAYAQAVATALATYFPISWEALNAYGNSPSA